MGRKHHRSPVGCRCSEGGRTVSDLDELADDALYCPCWNQTVSESCRGVCPFREAHGYVILVDQPIIDIDD